MGVNFQSRPDAIALLAEGGVEVGSLEDERVLASAIGSALTGRQGREERDALEACLGDLGDCANRVVIELLDSPLVAARLSGVRVCALRVHPILLERLASALDDVSPVVRDEARAGLRALGSRGVGSSALFGSLKAPHDAEKLRVAIEAVQHMRAAGAVPALIKLLDGAPHLALTHHALTRITGHRFESAWEWKAWRESAGRCRAEWLIDALRGREQDAREYAIAELRTLLGDVAPFDSAASRAFREAQIKRWEDFWREHRKPTIAPPPA